MTPALGKVEESLRRDIVRYSRWLSRLGYMPGTSGNLSVRLDSDRFLLTPTGISKGLIKTCDLVIVDQRGVLLQGSRKATSESDMHLAVYDQRPDATAVIHSHPPIATAFACSGRALDQVLCQEAVMTIGIVPLARYATTGTTDVAASLSTWLPNHDAILLENHGTITVGNSLVDAFMKTETLEHLAHVALVAHQLGSPRLLSTEQVGELRQARAKYLRGSEDRSQTMSQTTQPTLADVQA